MNSQEIPGTRREPHVRLGFTPAWASRRSKHHRELRQPPPSPEAPERTSELRGLNAYLMRRWAEGPGEDRV
jgi:hypothetical protein